MSCSRLNSNFKTSDSPEQYELYNIFKEECIKYTVEPISATLFGKVVSQVFPQAEVKRCRSKNNRKQFTRCYVGISIREEGPLYGTDLSAFRKHLIPDSFIMEETEQKVVVGFNTRKKSSGSHVIIETTINSSLQISVTVMSKPIDLRSVLFWEKMPELSSTSIIGLLESVKLLDFCTGVGLIGDSVSKQGVNSFEWMDSDGQLSILTCSKKCHVILPALHYGSKCRSCQAIGYSSKVSSSDQHEQVEQNEQAHTPSTPVLAPKAFTHACRSTPNQPIPQSMDACVGTTPLKDPEQVLLKFFPQLSNHQSLLSNLKQQITLAQQDDPRGRRYEKDLTA